jgi:Arc/MetJ-type ribon-helix-helix transcriptional regulator
MAIRKDGSKAPRITVAVPPEMIFATTALATSEYCSVSDVVRRALAEELIFAATCKSRMRHNPK